MVVLSHLEDLSNCVLYNSFFPISVRSVDGEIVQGDTEWEWRFRIRDAVFVTYVNVCDLQLYIFDYLRYQFLHECLVQF